MYFSKYMKDEVKIYDKLDKNYKNFTYFYNLNGRILLKLTILKKQLLFYITNNLKFSIFNYLYTKVFLHFFYKN